MGEWKRLSSVRVIPKPPIDALPAGGYRPMAEAVAASVECSTALTMICALGAAGACVNGRLRVKVRDGFEIPVVPHLSCILPAGKKKSPALHAMTDYLFELQEDDNRPHEKGEVYATEVRRLERLITKAIDGGKSKEHIAALAQDLEKYKKANAPIRRYAKGSNDTPEGLAADVSRQRDNTVSLIDAEGSMFDIACGTYAQKPDLTGYINLFDGEGVDMVRKGESLYVAKGSVAALILTQPVVFDTIRNDPRVSGKGFFARFMFGCAEDIIRGEEMPPPVSDTTLLSYQTSMFKLHTMEPFTIAFDKNAQKMHRQFVLKTEERAQFEWAPLAEVGFTGKMEGNCAMLAALLCAMEGLDIVRNEEVYRAIRLCEYFAECTLYLLADGDPLAGLSNGERYALKHILKQQTEGKCKAVVVRQALGKNGRYPADKANEIFRSLEKKGFIACDEQGSLHIKQIEVNPYLLGGDSYD